MTEERSQRVWLDTLGIHYQAAGEHSWTLPVADLLVVGEYTNRDGPALDDYFFVFLARPDRACRASFYSEGREAFLAALSTLLGVSLECKLAGSTDFASNVLWPKDIAGQPLYRFTERNVQGFILNVLRWFGYREQDVAYSPQVLAKFGRAQ